MKICVIPDCQVRPGDDVTFLKHIGHHIVAKKPDVIVNIGDFNDMCSLSSYDKGKKSFEGRRYTLDIDAGRQAMEALIGPIYEYNKLQAKNKKKLYTPRAVLTLGNHEQRIIKAVEDDAKLEGVLSIEDLGYTEYGWEVHPFLDVVSIEGVAFSHYFSSGLLGRPCASAAAQLAKKHSSCIAGHQQGLQIAMGHNAEGKRLTAAIAGSCYEHNEDYLGPQGNKHWRGILMLYNVSDGEFDLVPVPLSYLKAKYEKA